jgi:DNA gyrase subunit A
MYQLKVHQIPEGSRYAKGSHIANLLPLDREEWVATALTVREFEEDRYFLFVTKGGMVKRSSADLYRNARSSGIRAVNLKEGDELIMVREVAPKHQFVLATKNGASIRFNMNEVRPMGRNTAGVKGIALRKGDEVVAGVVVDPILDEVNGDSGMRPHLLTVSEKGYGKRTPISQYRIQSRGGYGVINMKVTAKTGNVVGAIMVGERDEVILLTSEGKVIRIGVSDISVVKGRATQGVRLVNIDNDGIVAGFDLVIDACTPEQPPLTKPGESGSEPGSESGKDGK